MNIVNKNPVKKWPTVNPITTAFRSHGSINAIKKTNSFKNPDFSVVSQIKKNKFDKKSENKSENKSQNNSENNNDTMNEFSLNEPFSMELLNKIKWIVPDNSISFKINFKDMENEYGIKYTKNILYSILNDEIGSFWLKLQNVYHDVEIYLN